MLAFFLIDHLNHFFSSTGALWDSSRHPEAETATEESKKESSLSPKGKCRRDCHFNPKWIKELKESPAVPRQGSRKWGGQGGASGPPNNSEGGGAGPPNISPMAIPHYTFKSCCNEDPESFCYSASIAHTLAESYMLWDSPNIINNFFYS